MIKNQTDGVSSKLEEVTAPVGTSTANIDQSAYDQTLSPYLLVR